MNFDARVFLFAILQARKAFEDYADERPSRGAEATRGVHTPSSNHQLSRLILRVQTLHFQAKNETTILSTTISRGVKLWQDIENWEGFDAGTLAGDEEMKWLYQSSLFIWLHLIVYPESIETEKLQQLATPGIEHFKNLSSSQAPALLLFPIFFHGLICRKDLDRQITMEAFSKLIPGGDESHFRIFEATITWCWRNYDHGAVRSWDWTDRVSPSFISSHPAFD
ncbi:hypothetical protein N7533_008869 [Penicillium manginii]|jgi:hypothetical protein|uniref:uncharacterized protein n=1 Tax=Penicillium manginii TaxID=203109 RepID=UPI002548B669|nr:uncharacterized protein N7533_008869 [Penicillium manginii]KAJ5743999.1 hypothetical protein N7533_008869 [Penicillium manginii]